MQIKPWTIEMGIIPGYHIPGLPSTIIECPFVSFFVAIPWLP
jgi:hypothetical protein